MQTFSSVIHDVKLLWRSYSTALREMKVKYYPAGVSSLKSFYSFFCFPSLFFFLSNLVQSKKNANVRSGTLMIKAQALWMCLWSLGLHMKSPCKTSFLKFWTTKFFCCLINKRNKHLRMKIAEWYLMFLFQQHFNVRKFVCGQPHRTFQMYNIINTNALYSKVWDIMALNVRENT